MRQLKATRRYWNENGRCNGPSWKDYIGAWGCGNRAFWYRKCHSFLLWGFLSRSWSYFGTGKFVCL